MAASIDNPIILTCAVTGGDDNTHRYPQVPVTPEQIANACIEAAKAGAAITHIHVRDPETGKPSMALALYAEVVDRIRASNVDVIINLSTGPGARFVPDITQKNTAAAGSNVAPAAERVRHIVELKPELCSLDMGTVNFGSGALINTPAQIRVIADGIRESGAKPELEIFDTGHIALANKLIADGVLGSPAFFQLALGIPWGAPATTETMALMQRLMPHGSRWAAFGIGRHEFPMVAQAALLGGHVRVGLEDNLYIEPGVQATSNAQLVEKAVKLLALLGKQPATAAQARATLGLAPR